MRRKSKFRTNDSRKSLNSPILQHVSEIDRKYIDNKHLLQTPPMKFNVFLILTYRSFPSICNYTTCVSFPSICRGAAIEGSRGFQPTVAHRPIPRRVASVDMSPTHSTAAPRRTGLWHKSSAGSAGVSPASSIEYGRRDACEFN